jgi:hypothetical protein
MTQATTSATGPVGAVAVAAVRGHWQPRRAHCSIISSSGGLVMCAGSGVVDGLITSFGDSFDEELTGTSTSLWIAGLIALAAGFLLGR